MTKEQKARAHLARAQELLGQGTLAFGVKQDLEVPGGPAPGHLQSAESLLSSQFHGAVSRRRTRQSNHPYTSSTGSHRRHMDIHRVQVYYGCDNSLFTLDMPPSHNARMKIEIFFKVMGVVYVRENQFVQVRIESMREYNRDGTTKYQEIPHMHHPEVGRIVNIQHYSTRGDQVRFKQRVRVMDSANDDDEDYLYEDWYFDERQWYLDVNFIELLRYAQHLDAQHLAATDDVIGRLRKLPLQ